MLSPDLNGRRLYLVERLLPLPEEQLAAVEQLLDSWSARCAGPGLSSALPAQRDWPHAPTHRLTEGQGTFIVTAGTHQKAHYFRATERLDYLEAELLAQAKAAGWHLEAWAVFSNHYHFVGHASAGCQPLADWLAELHRRTAGYVNELDQSPGRQVWFNYWDTELTFERSYFARLNYVHQNAVKHGLVAVANQYRWCSAAWFERTATPAQVNTIYSFKIDQLKVRDEFDPL